MGGKRGCALCGEMIDTGPRGTRRYCARCRKELERQRSRECQARKKGENADWQLRPQRSGHEAAAAAIAAQANAGGAELWKICEPGMGESPCTAEEARVGEGRSR